MAILLGVIACGLLSVVYAIWATRSVLAADQGNARMQEIAGYIREGAQAYLTRQYKTIAFVGVVVFIAAWLLLSSTAAVGFLIGAVLSAPVRLFQRTVLNTPAGPAVLIGLPTPGGVSTGSSEAKLIAMLGAAGAA